MMRMFSRADFLFVKELALSLLLVEVGVLAGLAAEMGEVGGEGRSVPQASHTR